MKRTLPPSDTHVIDGLKNAYGIDVTTLTRLSLGADIDALTYKAHAHDGSFYFVKLKQNHDHGISTHILALLRQSGLQQIIPLLPTVTGAPAQTLGDWTMTISPFIEGTNGFSRDLTKAQWHTLGEIMKKIHQIDVPHSLQSLMRREVYAPTWREAVRSLYSLMEAAPKGDAIAVNLLIFMKKHKDTLHRLVNRAEKLAEKSQKQSLESVLCHTDIHAGNILIDQNDTLYVVDWDAPMMAPKERDLMFIGGGVGNIWNKADEEKWFYQGYGKAPINQTLLAYYRHERILEDIAIYGQQLLLKDEGGSERTTWYTDFIAQFAPHGVVDIAFKTDDALNFQGS